MKTITAIIALIVIIVVAAIAVYGYYAVNNIINNGVTVTLNATQLAGVNPNTLNPAPSPNYPQLANTTVFSPP